VKDEEEAKRDMTYEEFMGKYGDMIEGKQAAGQREDRAMSSHSRPVTGHPEDDGKSDAARSEKRKKASSAMSKGSHTGANSMNNTKEGFDLKDELRYDIPESCLLFLMKGNKISKMDKKFKLLSHPYPILEGEMILFQPMKQD
jgi:hypothetical protein